MDGAGVTGATSATLALTAPFTFDASKISVRVSNGDGVTVSRDALLTVTAVAPTLVTPPASANVMAGMPATFSVSVTGGTAPMTYQWKRDGKAVLGATAASYAIAATVPSDNGATFSVDVVNPAGTQSVGPATLTVIVGKTWGPAAQLSNGDASSAPGHSDVAIDTAGNAVAVWQQVASARNTVFASQYAAGGAWSAAAAIDDAVGNASQPRVAVTPSGTAVAAFLQVSGTSVVLNTNRFSGSWGGPRRVDTGTAPADLQQVAIAADGTATVTFLQSDNVFPRVWAANSTSPTAWAAPTIVDANGGTLPQIGVAANGHAVASWVESKGPSARALWTSRNTGAGWSAPVLLTSDVGLVDTSIHVAADATGNTMAVWSQLMAGHYTVRAARMNAATGVWSAPIALSDGTHDAVAEQLATDAAGNVAAVWNETNLGIFGNRYVAGTATWSGPAAISPNAAPTVPPTPKVAVDAGGNAVVAWLASKSGTVGAHVFVAHSVPSATGWTAPVAMMVDPNAYVAGGNDEQVAVSANAKGEAVVTWYQQVDTPAAAGIWARVYR
jgi:hypothetical protein